MTYDETLQVLAIMKANYNSFFRSMSKTDATGLAALWAEMFSDTDYSLVCAAVKSYIATDVSGYPPNVGQINSEIRKLTEKHQMTEQEAVGIIFNACRNGIYGSEEEFQKLPPVLQRLVGNPGQLKVWAMMDEDELHTVVASNLMRSYKVVAKREEEFKSLPSSVKQLLGEVSDRFRLEKGRTEDVLQGS